VCELNGAVYPGKVGVFRVIPYFARKSIRLKHKIEELIDMSKTDLDSLVAEMEEKDKAHGRDLQFDGINLNPNWETEDPAELSDEPLEPEFEDEEYEPETQVSKGPRRSKRLKN
jgi:hypothetical protein